MKFRIMRDSIGKYVKKQNIFGIWCNWSLSNDCVIFFRQYYDCSDDELVMYIKEITESPKLLKEFTI